MNITETMWMLCAELNHTASGQIKRTEVIDYEEVGIEVDNESAKVKDGEGQTHRLMYMCKFKIKKKKKKKCSQHTISLQQCLINGVDNQKTSLHPSFLQHYIYIEYSFSLQKSYTNNKSQKYDSCNFYKVFGNKP